jgi:outer membrane receptor protein involved in Fe transport
MIHLVQSAFGRRTGWLAGAALAAVIGTAAHAQASYTVDIGAAGLEPALLTLASQTKQQIFFPKALVSGLRTPAIRGSFTAEQALARMLAGTDLRARRVSDKLIIVERNGPNITPAATGPTLGTQGPFVPGLERTEPTERALAEGRIAIPPPTLVEELRVTGTHIRGARSASPLVVMDRAALDRSGHATVAAALAALPQAFATGASEGTISTGSDKIVRNVNYGASVNLRGLGADATLILVNGRRLSGSGSYGDFSDISAIPTAAVERVEILLDGASALYGADAVGGVVNIILRKDFPGAETRLYAGVGTTGEPTQVQVSQTLGRQWSSGSVLLALEYQKRDALRAEDRAYTASADLRRFGGTDWRVTNSFPGNILGPDPITGAQVARWGIPAGQNGVGLQPSDFQAGVINLENPRAGIDTLPRQVLQSAYLTANQAVGAVEVSAEVRYAFRKYGLRPGGSATTLTVNRANPFFVSPNGSSSHTIAYAPGDLANPHRIGSAETWSATLGAKAPLFADWQADGYLGFAQEIGESRTTGVLHSLFLSEALGTVADRADTAFSAARDGYFNPFSGVPGANTPAVLAFVGSGFASTRARITAYVASAQADGTLFQLPGGAVKLALGGQARAESLFNTGTNFATTPVPVPQQTDTVRRKTLAGFAELRAPLIGEANRRRGMEALEVSLAGRVERYDDVGTTANPKAGLLWRPADGLTLRGTYGRSFRAPNLREVSDPQSNATFLLTDRNGARLRVLALSGGNVDLRPETATTWTVGLDLQPAALPGFTASLTGFDIAFRDRIDRPVQQNTVAALIDPTLAPFVQYVAPAANAADRTLIETLLRHPGTSATAAAFPPEAFAAILDNRYVNTTTVRLRGVDASAGYRFDLGADQVALAINATYMADYQQQLTPSSAGQERVGLASFPVKLRGRMTADWTRDRLTVGAAINYVDGSRDVLGAGIDAQTTVDLQIRLAAPERGFAQGVAVTFNVRNLFDDGPPFYDNPAGIAYDPTNGDPIGRFAAVQLTRSW